MSNWATEMGLDKLMERASKEVEAWRPDAGDVLAGIVIEIDEKDSEYGDPYPILTIETENDLRAFHAFHTVARNEVARGRPEVGDKIAVKYFGIRKSKTEVEFHSYKVAVMKAAYTPPPPVDWDSHLEATADDLSVQNQADDGIPF